MMHRVYDVVRGNPVQTSGAFSISFLSPLKNAGVVLSYHYTRSRTIVLLLLLPFTTTTTARRNILLPPLLLLHPQRYLKHNHQ
jgi:hypothetical protein